MYQIKDINKKFNELKVLEDITIDFPKNKTTCILGPSGCGKTTLLNIIAGIIKKDSGEIIGFNKDISFVFQEDRLIEWKNIEENISFVLKGKMDKEQIKATIDKYLKLVKLEEYKYYYPKELSGGMRQKISILRAFAYPSKLLIMDEPFKSLDINSKQILIDFFKELRIIENRTCIIVTHDIEEALTLGDRIIILTGKPTAVKRVMELNGNEENMIKLREVIEKEFMI
ncbi:NitT/TauT family transport system ATP-binding protein [Tissierella praeacuta DSM 18095]|uniref:NitT/TauT family transport system ATP-binding protein n=1 Tax=Tissierella praeacuta DSM 18095 TaxID=1123404 RepID=A0A1M4YCU4_9FIRM|nr:ATP-binding cassette domain-containing protein [Tissierella praeacuta]TCU74210.1 NitT/TauT family transport system ATP-binding protein [Tissierella praeacuta]SHF03403.1 NitT/TauT family transport system ATP-binding protein [Tissierella praeacuta DSM 18095]SUP03192.1 Sulfate/thiosulfate import ATP-binding protein CysA [Tissierella praeacuta]